MTTVMTDSPDSGLTGDENLEDSISTDQKASTLAYHDQPSGLEQIFSITDVSPTSAPTTEETKVLFFKLYTLPLTDIVMSHTGYILLIYKEYLLYWLKNI